MNGIKPWNACFCLGLSSIAFSFSAKNNMTVFDGNIDSRIYILAHFAFGSLNGNHMSSFRVTVTPAGILMGNFPILDIANSSY